MDCDQESTQGIQEYGDWLRASPNKLKLDGHQTEREKEKSLFQKESEGGGRDRAVTRVEGAIKSLARVLNEEECDESGKSEE